MMDKLWTAALVLGCAIACIALVEVTFHGMAAQSVEQMTGKLETVAPQWVECQEAQVEQMTGKLETVAPPEPEPTYETPLTETELAALLEACEEGSLDPALALGLIQVESSFQDSAVNPTSGCYGYCQLNPAYFPAGLTPEENIRTGIQYLAEQVERYGGDEGAGLTAYHAGYDTGDRSYADLVLAAAEGWRVEDEILGV